MFVLDHCEGVPGQVGVLIWQGDLMSAARSVQSLQSLHWTSYTMQYNAEQHRGQGQPRSCMFFRGVRSHNLVVLAGL